jgi:4-amino-4-deoxy-L-arabinose transferase-like glycosyltransferase
VPKSAKIRGYYSPMKSRFNKFVLSKPLLAISGVILAGVILRFARFYDFITFGHDNSRDNIVAYKMYEYGEYIFVGPVFSVVWGFMSPIYYYLLYPFFVLFKFSPISAPIASLVANIAALVLITFVAYKLYGKAAAFISAAIFGFSVYIIRLGGEGLNPSLMLPFAILAFYAYVEWLKTSRAKFLYWFAFGLSFVTALHPAGFFLLIPFIALYFFYKPKITIKSFLISAGIYGLLGVVPYLIQEKKLAWWTIKQLIAYLKHGGEEKVSFINSTLNYFTAVLKNISFTLFNNTDQISMVIAGIILAFIVYEAVSFFKKRNNSTILAFTLFLYILVFGFIVKFDTSEPHAKWFFAAFVPLLVLYIASLLARLYRTNYWYATLLILFGFTMMNLSQYFTVAREVDSYSYTKEVAEVIRKDSNGADIDIYGGNAEPIYYMLWYYETNSELKEKYFNWIKWAKEKDGDNKAYYVELKDELSHNKIEEIKDKHNATMYEPIYTSETGKKIYIFK